MLKGVDFFTEDERVLMDQARITIAAGENQPPIMRLICKLEALLEMERPFAIPDDLDLMEVEELHEVNKRVNGRLGTVKRLRALGITETVNGQALKKKVTEVSRLRRDLAQELSQRSLLEGM